jgi:hypothetical protein
MFYIVLMLEIFLKNIILKYLWIRSNFYRKFKDAFSNYLVQDV